MIESKGTLMFWEFVTTAPSVFLMLGRKPENPEKQSILDRLQLLSHMPTPGIEPPVEAVTSERRTSALSAIINEHFEYELILNYNSCLSLPETTSDTPQRFTMKDQN